MATVRLTVEGLPRDNGSYEIEFESLTGEDLHEIKKVSGVRLNEINDALLAGDFDLIIALTRIAALRDGKDIPVAELMKLPLQSFGSEAVEPEEGDGDELPPVSRPAASDTSDGSKASSTPSSSNDSADYLETTPLPIGDRS